MTTPTTKSANPKQLIYESFYNLYCIRIMAKENALSSGSTWH